MIVEAADLKEIIKIRTELTLDVVSLTYPRRHSSLATLETPTMTVALPLWTATVLIIVASLIISIVLQMAAQRGAAKHQAELREKLDEQRAEMAANRERLERRAQEVRETQHESLDLKRKEIALREEQATSLRKLIAIHEELLGELRGRRPS